MSHDPTVFACDISRMNAAQRERYRVLVARLLERAALEELPNGYAMRFAYSDALALALAEFVTLERLCCPFLTLGVEVEGEALRLRLTGADGVKPFVAAEFRLETAGAS